MSKKTATKSSASPLSGGGGLFFFFFLYTKGLDVPSDRLGYKPKKQRRIFPPWWRTKMSSRDVLFQRAMC